MEIFLRCFKDAIVAKFRRNRRVTLIKHSSEVDVEKKGSYTIVFRSYLPQLKDKEVETCKSVNRRGIITTWLSLSDEALCALLEVYCIMKKKEIRERENSENEVENRQDKI